MFAFTPFGGSLVIFTPSISSYYGNDSVLAVVNHNRNSLFIFNSRSLSFFSNSALTCSNRASNYGNQLTAKWQFCKITHVPAPSDSRMARLAYSP